jgi:hypothetical protein
MAGLLVGTDPKFMDIVERSRAYCSSFIHAQPPVALLGFLFKGIDNLFAF